MADSNDNGKNGKGPTTPMKLGPDNIRHQVTVVLTTDNQYAIMGELDNLPLLLHLLSQGIDIVGGLVSKALPKRIQVVGSLPPGVPPHGRAGG